MQELADKLKQAQLQHVMDKLQASERAVAQQAAHHLMAWSREQALASVTDEKTIAALVEHIRQVDPNPQLNARIANLLDRLFALDALKQPIGSVLDRDATQRLVEQILSLEEARTRLIHGFIDNPIFSHLLTDILYNGIKSYMTDENGISSRIPGMSSVVKMGKWATSKGGMDQTIDKTVKYYLKNNIESSIQFAEKLVNDMLSPKSVGKLYGQIWERIDDKSIGMLTQQLRHKDSEKIADAIVAAWQSMRKNDELMRLVQGAITQTVHDLEGNVSDWLAALNIDEAWLAHLVEKILTGVTRNDVAMRHIEQWLAAELDDFYRSPAFQGIAG